MHSDATCSWLDDAARDVARLVDDTEPALQRRLRPLVERIARMNGGDGLRDALLRPGSTPFVRIIDAAALDLGLAGDPRVASIGRATVMSYLYVRLQDDLVDEEALIDRASVYAMEVALAEHLRHLADAGVPAKFWRARSRVMARFAAFAAREVDERGAAEGAPAERHGDKFLPLAVPLLALASLAGRDALHDVLIDHVVHLGAALQVINDVLNAAEDRAAERTTPFLRWLGPLDAPDLGAFRAAVQAHPATDRALALARAQAGRAASLAAAHELARLAGLAGAVERLVDRTRPRLLGLQLGIQA